MEQKSTFVKQAAILAATGLIARVIGFLYRLPLTNSILGDRGNGIYGQSYYLYMLFLIISSAGLPAAISKMVSHRLSLNQYRNAHEVFRTALIISGITGLICALILGLGAGFLAESLGWPESTYSILALSPTVLIVAIMAVFRGYFQGMNNTIPTSISQLLEQIFNAVFSIVLSWMLLDRGLELAAAGATAGTGIGALAGLLVLVIIYRMASPTIRRRVRHDKDRSQYERRSDLAIEIIQTSVPIILGTAVFSFTNIIDMVMVSSRLTAAGAFTDAEAQSLYGILTGKYATLTTLPVSISTSIATAAIPTIVSSLAVRDYKGVHHKINVALRLTMFIGIPAAVGMGVLADQILHMLFPSQSAGAVLIRVGAVSIIFLSIVQIITGILQSVGRLHYPVFGALAGVLLKIPLNYYLIAIPEINVNGAVISTVACYGMASLLDIIFLKRFTGITLDIVGTLMKPLFSAGIMGLTCYIVYYVILYAAPYNTPALFCAIGAGVLVYVAAMLAVKGFERNDIIMLPGGNKMADFLEKNGLL